MSCMHGGLTSPWSDTSVEDKTAGLRQLKQDIPASVNQQQQMVTDVLDDQLQLFQTYLLTAGESNRHACICWSSAIVTNMPCVLFKVVLDFDPQSHPGACTLGSGVMT